ncbi:MipA/OmpV family protein [Roseinatronobacter alkalisoli]|uniref:MipA/OmpV family protein n=1 Tax=Roseinatronobacter alkalisoli TaxID=3028235 RepID=A0ABT5T5Q5_9RHOB|nr:MipA/OmpV family protein [Roseinatronobacter sp. HJB301]MDD7970309.1 MipA/OmpV family protein [Roseinatronobacter sp. HJB301]
MSPNTRKFLAPFLIAALSMTTTSALAQDRALAFSVTGGVATAPKYFGADSNRIAPGGAFGFTGLRFGSAQLGDPDGPTQFATGTGLRGSLRYIPKRKGENELAGMDDVKAALEIGAGVHHTTEFWQVFADLRYGVIGHKGVTGEIGANAIYRGADGLVVHAGPRAGSGNSRFARSYFGVSAAESVTSGLAAYTPSGGVHSVGVELGVYQPLSDDWGITGALRYDRLRGDAASSPIVQQGSRDQFGASIGITRHFNFRF